MQDNINKTIKENVGLVYKQLGKFKLVDDQDAESLGYEALYKAAQTYDAKKNIAFSTYATSCIYNALCGYLRTVNKKRQLDVVSLNEPIDQDELGKGQLLDNYVTANSIDDVLCSAERGSDIDRAIRRAYADMRNEKYQSIIFEWALSDFTAKQTNLSARLGVTQSCVSLAINIFRAKLINELKEE